MWDCESCNAQFYYESYLLDHMTDEEHWPECDTCPKRFRTWRACNQHMDAVEHHEPPRYECQTCDKDYPSQDAAEQHMDQRGHWLWQKSYCNDCELQFRTENDLKMHLNSGVHRGSKIICPFCKTKYATASGLTHHLEKGACPNAPGLNRETILQLVREKDPHGHITKKQIGWHDDVTYIPTDAAWNGRAWECYLCHRQFGKWQSLKQHLDSPTHKQKVYRCPQRSCAKEFTSLAGLFGHWESETCGFMRFEKVQQHMDKIVSGNRRLTFL